MLHHDLDARAQNLGTSSFRCAKYRVLLFDDVEHLETQGQEQGQSRGRAGAGQGQEPCSGQPPTLLAPWSTWQ